MALTASQVAVSLFGAAVGGYKTGIETFAAANGETATVNALIGSSTLSGLANGVFAAKLVDLTIGSSATTANKNWLANAIEANLNAGQSKATMVTAVINALTNSALNSDANWGTAAAQFQNRVTVSDYYAAKDGASTDLTVLQNLANQVTSDATTVTTAKAAVDAGQAGYNTFSLTSNTIADVPKLTASSDVITAAAGTLNSNDVISDSTTTDNDTLNAVLTSSLATGPVIANIENVNLDFKGFGLTFSAASTTNSNITVSTTQEGNTSATLASVGATDKVTVGAGISTLTLTSSGTTLNLTGGQALTVNNNAAAGTMAFVSGGSSANTITYDAAAVKSLAVSGSQSLTIKTAQIAADFGGNTVSKTLSGTASLTLELTAAGAAAADLSKVAADSFNLNVAGTQSLGLASGANVTLSKDIGSSTLGVGTLAVDSSNDRLNLKIAANQTGTLGVNAFETVNLAIATSTPASIATLDVSTITTGVANTVNLTGSQNTTIGTLTGSATATAATTLNASDFGAKLTVTVGANAATVVGGASADTITGGTNADLIIGGAGTDTLISGGTAGDTVNDTIVGGSGNDVVNLGTSNTTAIVLGTSASINGGDGTDTLDFTTTSATTLTGKVIAFESVTVRATASAVTWTTADSDVTTGSTLVFEVAAGTATDVLTFNGAAETDASFNIKVTNNAINVITGGALADSISVLASSKANTITAGKGADIITLSNTTTNGDVLKFAAGDSGVTVATADVINGAGATDVLKFTSISATAETSALATGSQLGTGWSVATTGIATKTNATLDDFITAATAAAKAGATGMNGQAVAFISGADTYVFAAGTDTAANTDDGLVKLTGLVIADLSTGAYSTAGEFILS